jgi:hypothetical protein
LDGRVGWEIVRRGPKSTYWTDHANLSRAMLDFGELSRAALAQACFMADVKALPGQSMIRAIPTFRIQHGRRARL